MDTDDVFMSKFYKNVNAKKNTLASKSSIIIPSCFRSELDLSQTDIPEKDIKILNLLLKR